MARLRYHELGVWPEQDLVLPRYGAVVLDAATVCQSDAENDAANEAESRA